MYLLFIQMNIVLEDPRCMCFLLYQRLPVHFQIQAVIDSNVFPVLIDILGKGEFKTRKEAAWAITNTSSGGIYAHMFFMRYEIDY